MTTLALTPRSVKTDENLSPVSAPALRRQERKRERKSQVRKRSENIQVYGNELIRTETQCKRAETGNFSRDRTPTLRGQIARVLDWLRIRSYTHGINSEQRELSSMQTICQN
jgi:hypothetical protein